MVKPIQMIIWVLAVACLVAGVTPAGAQPGSHAHEALSPLTETDHSHARTDGLKFFCPVHEHYSAKPCPHLHRINQDVYRIAADCGGHPAGHLPNSFSFEHNPGLDESPKPFDSAIEQETLKLLSLVHNPLLSDPPEHPPKSL